MSSWVYGDPAPPILRAYVGDPSKIRLIHGGVKETHVFYLHNHQWRLEGDNPLSTIIDSITISPQECYTLDILYGAGSRNGLDMPPRPSCRVSLNPQFLQYDPVNDSGINVGYNSREQTVGIGESKRYLWKADREYGTCILQSFGDLRNHRYHGLFGAVIVEPVGAVWYRNMTRKKDPFAEQAVISAPGMESFREYVLFIQNGIRLLDEQGELIRTAEDVSGETVDAEDTGEKGYNYRSERFVNRMQKDKRIWKVFSSRVHGDPATPVWKAYPGDRVIFRTMMPADKSRNVSLTVHGHMWKEQPEDARSRVIPLQGGISIGNRFDMELRGGAGEPGDYLYRSGSFRWDVESGMWGIFRVIKQSMGCRCREVCRKVLGCRKKN